MKFQKLLALLLALVMVLALAACGNDDAKKDDGDKEPASTTAPTDPADPTDPEETEPTVPSEPTEPEPAEPPEPPVTGPPDAEESARPKDEEEESK